MAYLINFSFEFFYEMFTEDAPLLLLYHGAKKSKMSHWLEKRGIIKIDGKVRTKELR